MNHLQHLFHLNNRYYAMRHGQSKANVDGIIVSHPHVGRRPEHGLTDQGRIQSQQAALNAALSSGTIIVSSDFSRALETAQTVQQAIRAPKVLPSKKLRERYFGKWDQTNHSNYELVWSEDSQDPSHTKAKVESANSVLDRTTALIVELERRYRGQAILLIAHGDVLQILQTGFHKASPAQHRSLPHLDVAEIRRLHIRPSRLRATGTV